MPRGAILLSAIFALAQLSFAEEIHLKDGSKLTGQITAVTADKFQVKTSYGEMQVPRTDILSIDFPENQPKSAAKQSPVVDESLTGTSYVNRTGGFGFTVPNGWSLAPELKSKDILAALKSADEAQFAMVTVERFDHPLPAYISMVEANMKASFNNFQEISQADATVAGQKAVRLILRGDIKENNMPAKFMVYIFSDGENMTRLSFLTAEALFDESASRFEKIAASYRSIDTLNKNTLNK